MYYIVKLVTLPLPPPPPPPTRAEPICRISCNCLRFFPYRMGLDPYGFRSKTWPMAISGHPSSLAHHKSTALRSHILCLWRSNAPTQCTVYFVLFYQRVKNQKSCTAPACPFYACTCLRKINKYS